MHLDLTDEQKTLQREVREYMAGLMTPELDQELHDTEGGGPLYTKALQSLGRDGWLGLGWPVEYGGQGRPAIDQFLLSDEIQRSGFPLPLLTLGTVGPAIMAHGSPAHRQRFLPAILRGQVHFSIGYTEPSAGTDLASLSTTAVLDGDEFVVNGQKIFTSLAHVCDYIWTAVRTDPDAARPHKGISILIIDKTLPGVSFTPTGTLGDNRCYTTYLENVRVPADMLVGELHGGWRLITSQLNHERVSLFAVGWIERLLDGTKAWARETGAVKKDWVRANIARVHAGLEVLRLLNWRQAWNIDEGGLPPQEASAVKVYGSEFYVQACRLLMEVLGAAGSLKRGSPGAALEGRLERFYRASLVLTFGGGANEIQRDIICQVGLGMPRPPR
jgi:alkylation response protein AidB-like acyl-CoA dehydrogenase